MPSGTSLVVADQSEALQSVFKASGEAGRLTAKVKYANFTGGPAVLEAFRAGAAQLARRERLTVRELILRLGGGRGHHTFVGTPEQVTETLERWFRAGAADGFNIMAPVLPSGLEESAPQGPLPGGRGAAAAEHRGPGGARVSGAVTWRGR